MRSVGIVLNLTTPQGHYPVARTAVEAGKSVHNEKPLTLSWEEGRSRPQGLTTGQVK